METLFNFGLSLDNGGKNLSYWDPWPVHYKEPPMTLVPAFSFESTDIMAWRIYVTANFHIPWIAVAVYLTVIFGLQKFMQNRQPIKAKWSLIFWNGGLALFSIFGCFRITEEIVYRFMEGGYFGTICVSTPRNATSEYWIFLFMLSKFLELGDTVFIVLRKQPLVALQWYHHALVVVVAWKLFAWGEPVILWFAAINYGVHSFMYSYFAVRALGIRVPEPLAKFITILQILQMIVNTLNNVYSVVVPYFGFPCLRHPNSVIWGLITYASLWYLFSQFFVKRYSKDKKQKSL